MLLYMIFASIFIDKLNAVIYDSYLGIPATKQQMKLYTERNNSMYCAIDIEPCDSNAWRRIDGSCNNLKYPSRGTARTPTIRLLTPEFSIDYEPRNLKSGEPYPLGRYIRTELVQEGKAHDQTITQLNSYFLVFAFLDISSIHDIVNYLENTTNCCTPEGKSNYACTPSVIPVDDPVHRYSGVRCQNLTRPQSFQYFGCAEFRTTPFTRILFATPAFDLSLIYNHLPGSINHIRTFKKGLLAYDLRTFKETGQVFPVGNHTEAFNKRHCSLNEYPKEHLCYQYNPNAVIGSNLILVLFYRQHNYIAKLLHKLNPCWDDDRLFYTARDINIAIYMQIYFYELLPVWLGRRNLQTDGLIQCSKGFRDIYDENITPQNFEEFGYVYRWFHTIQDATVKVYDEDGAFLKTLPMVNLTDKQGYVAADNNIDKILRGSFRQASARADHTYDYDITERILGGIQFASDVVANDLIKGRYIGFPSYVKYREYCTGKQYNSFHDLRDVMSEERIYRLRHVYENIEDVELMAGLWGEKLIPGGKVPHTVYCLMVKQLKRSLASDRHWFERPNRPHAFNNKQLQAIRKVTIAGVMCTNSNSVPEIQLRAFYSINKKTNPLLDCGSPEIGKLDLSPWKDSTCKKN